MTPKYVHVPFSTSQKFYLIWQKILATVLNDPEMGAIILNYPDGHNISSLVPIRTTSERGTKGVRGAGDVKIGAGVGVMYFEAEGGS